MSAETEDRLRDVAAWYFGNKDRIPPDNLRKRLDFQQKAQLCLIELMAIMMKDIQELEQRRPRSKLWMPTGVQLDGEQPVKLEY